MLKKKKGGGGRDSISGGMVKVYLHRPTPGSQNSHWLQNLADGYRLGYNVGTLKMAKI